MTKYTEPALHWDILIRDFPESLLMKIPPTPDE